VTFIFAGAELKHMIMSEGTPAFAASAPDAQAHAVKFTVGGTYQYKDVYMPSLRGRIIVN
jgi:hypothetical protein